MPKGIFKHKPHRGTFKKGWAMFPELRFELDNGQTLCKPCHKLTNNYKGKGKRKIK
jgi:hypothetical protein